MDEESVQFYQCIFRDLKKKKVLEEKMSLQNADQRISNTTEMISQASFVVYPKQLTTKPIVKNDRSPCNGASVRVNISKSVDSCHNQQVSVGVPSVKSKSGSDLKLDNSSKSVPKQERRSVSRRKRDCERRDEHDLGVRKEKPKCTSNLQRDNSEGGGCASMSGRAVASKSEGSIASVGKQHGNAEGRASSKSKHGCNESITTDGGEGECKTEKELSRTSQKDNTIIEDKSKCKNPRQQNQIGVSILKCDVDCNQEKVRNDLKTKIINICKKGKQSIMSTASNHKGDKLDTVSNKIKVDVSVEVMTDKADLSTDNTSICKKEKKITASSSSEDNRKHLKDNVVSSRTEADTCKNDESNGESLSTAECVSKKEKKVSSSDRASKHVNIEEISNEMKAVTFHVDGQSAGGAGMLRTKGESNNANVSASSNVECKIKDGQSNGGTDTTLPDLCSGRMKTVNDQVDSRKGRKTEVPSNNEDRQENGKVDGSSNPNTLPTSDDGKVDTSETRIANKKVRRHAVKSKSEITCTKDKAEGRSKSKCATLGKERTLDGEDKEKRRRKIRETRSKSEGTFKNDKLEVGDKSNSASISAKENLESSCSQTTKHITKRKRKNSTTSTLADTSQTEQLEATSNSSSATTCSKETLDTTRSHRTINVKKRRVKNTTTSTLADTSKADELAASSNSSSATTCSDPTLEGVSSQINQIHRRSRRAVTTSVSEHTISTSEFGTPSNTSSATTCNSDILGDACTNVTKKSTRKSSKDVSTSASEFTICTGDQLGAVSNSSSATIFNNEILGDACSKVTKHVTRKSRKPVDTSASEYTISTGDKLGTVSNSSNATTCNNDILRDACSKITKLSTRKSRKPVDTSASENTISTGDKLKAVSNSSSATTCNNDTIGDACSKIAKLSTRKSRKPVDTSASEYTISTGDKLGAVSNSSSATTCNNDTIGDACSKIAKLSTRKSRKPVDTSASEYTISTGDKLKAVSNSSSATTCNNDTIGDACSKIAKLSTRKSRKPVDTSASEYTISTGDKLGAVSNSSSATTCNNDTIGDACSKIAKLSTRKSRKPVDTSASEYTISTGDKLGAVSNSSSATTCNNDTIGDACSKIAKLSTRKSRKPVDTSASEYTKSTGDKLGAVSNSSSATTCNNDTIGDACSKIAKLSTRKSRKPVDTSASESPKRTNDELGAASNSGSAASCNDGKLEGTCSEPGKHVNRETRKYSATLTRENNSASEVLASTSNISSATTRKERKSESSSTLVSRDICKKETFRNISLPKSIGVRYQEQLQKPSFSKSDGHCDQKTQFPNLFPSKSTGACVAGDGGDNKSEGDEVLSSSWSLSESEYELRKVRTKYVSTSSSSRTCFSDNSSSATTVPASSKSASRGMRSARSCSELSDAGRVHRPVAGEGQDEEPPPGVRREGGYADKFRSVLATVKELEESVAQSHRDGDLIMMHTAHVEELNELLGQQVARTSSSTFKDKNKRLKRRLRHRKIQFENLRALLRLREDHLCDCMDEVGRLKNNLLDRERTISRVCEMFLKLKAKKDEQVMRAERLQAELDDVTRMFAHLQATPSERASGASDSVEDLLLEQVKKNSRLTLENSRLRKHLSSLSRATDPASSDPTRLDLNNSMCRD